jgi:anti-sigma factor RsiW
MNLNLLQHKLFQAARAARPDDRVPYAFEQRVMASLRGQRGLDSLTLWTRALWRAAAPCAALMVLLVSWSVVTPESVGQETDLGQQLEAAMFASLPAETDINW